MRKVLANLSSREERTLGLDRSIDCWMMWRKKSDRIEAAVSGEWWRGMS